MKNEKIIELLTQAVNNNDKIIVLNLIDQLKTEMLNESTKKAVGATKTSIIKKLLKDARKSVESYCYSNEKPEESPKAFMLKPFKVGDYSVITTPYRFIASLDTIPGTAENVQTFSNYGKFIETCKHDATVSNYCYKIPTVSELTALYKILKAEHKKDVYKISVCDKVVLKAEFLIDAMNFVNTDKIYIKAENQMVTLASDKEIAAICPITKDRKTGNVDSIYIYINEDGKPSIKTAPAEEKTA